MAGDEPSLQQLHILEESRRQGRSDRGYIGIYTPTKKSVYLTNFYVVTGCFFL